MVRDCLHNHEQFGSPQQSHVQLHLLTSRGKRKLLLRKSKSREATWELSLDKFCALPISEAQVFISDLILDDTQQIIATELLKEIRSRLQFLDQVGLGYLALDRKAPTLSGGESQRIRLAAQIGSGLSGVLYVLDEPSIGLHPRDNIKLLGALETLRDKGNTVVVVEHDEETIRAADWVVDFGPGPGKRGGEVVAAGSPQDIEKNSRSITGAFLSGRDAIVLPETRRKPDDRTLILEGVRHNNLKGIDVEIPLGLFVCITGVSGSGKSSLVSDVLEPSLRSMLGSDAAVPGDFDALVGGEQLDKVIVIDQSPIGRTPRSNPSTYVKVWDDIRKLFHDASRCSASWLESRPVFIQCRRWSLRGMRRARVNASRHGLSC
jgi:excinuclease ABC subunit A